jgi:hypothetical protein
MPERYRRPARRADQSRVLRSSVRLGRDPLPFTYLAHQAPALALKQRWPTWFDGTALVLGTMAPDWAYALNGSALAFDAHSLLGVVAFCTPMAMVVAAVLRRVSPTLFTYAPNPKQMPLQQLRVLALRRPPLATTALSACLGALTHVAWDLFTHNDRWGPRHIGWLRSEAVSLLGHSVTWAKVLQYASHTLGSAVAVLLLARILRSGDLLRWYGIDDSRTGDRRPGSIRFVIVTIIGTLAGGAWAAMGHGLPAQIIRLTIGLAVGLVVASLVCRRVVAVGLRAAPRTQ